jgi:hypothetical protein
MLFEPATWTEFTATIQQKDGIFRLNPTYCEPGYKLDDFRKLDEIQNQMEK